MMKAKQLRKKIILLTLALIPVLFEPSFSVEYSCPNYYLPLGAPVYEIPETLNFIIIDTQGKVVIVDLTRFTLTAGCNEYHEFDLNKNNIPTGMPPVDTDTSVFEVALTITVLDQNRIFVLSKMKQSGSPDFNFMTVYI